MIAEIGAPQDLRKNPEEEAIPLVDDLLAGLDASDVALLSSPAASSVDSDEFKDIKEPHWLFDTQKLFDRIKPLAIIVKDRQELVPRCVVMEPVAGGVLFRVNTGEAQAEIQVDLDNKVNPLTKTYIVEFKVMFAVIRNSGQKVLFREKGTGLQVSVLGGDVELESYNLDPKVFTNPEFANQDKSIRVEGGLFQKFLSRGQAAMALATRPEDRKVRVENGVAMSNFMTTLFLQNSVPLNAISLRAVDLIFLRWMFEGVTEFHYLEGVKSYIFWAPNTRIATPKVDTVDLASVRVTYEGLKPVKNFSVAPSHFYRVVALVKNMIGGTGSVKIKPEGGKLYLSATTKSSKSLKFPIAAASDCKDFTVSCSIASLVTTAGMFRKDPVLNAVVDEQNRFYFENDGLCVLFGSIPQ